MLDIRRSIERQQEREDLEFERYKWQELFREASDNLTDSNPEDLGELAQ